MREPLPHHGENNRIGNPRSSRAAAQDGDALISEPLFDCFCSSQKRSQSHRRCPLNIIIEGENSFLIAIEEFAGILFSKVLPLQKNFGIALFNRSNKFFHKCVVFRTFEPSVLPS